MAIAQAQVIEIRDFFQKVPESQSVILHAPYKWTTKQVVGHLIDADRVFADRMHKFAAADFQPLNGMEQEPYVENQDFNTPTLSALVEELLLCREANILLMRRMKSTAWDHRGIASEKPVTVRALAYIQVGHITYHLKILRKRLGIDVGL